MPVKLKQEERSDKPAPNSNERITYNIGTLICLKVKNGISEILTMTADVMLSFLCAALST